MLRISYICILFTLSILLVACKGNTGIEVSTEEIEDKDYPISIEASSYYTISKGKYIRRSTEKKFIEASNNIIDIHHLTDSANFFLNNHYMYLANEEPIALFKTRYPTEDNDVAGVFDGGSLVYVDTVFYNAIYNDSEKAPMAMEAWYELTDKESLEAYPLEYDVWYAIRINGKRYYTDYKVHNYVDAKLYLPAKNQLFVVCSQAGGYDGGYDRGYPDYYEVTVYERPAIEKDVWKRIYRSPKLNLNNGGSDEFGIADLFLTTEGSVVSQPIDCNGNVNIEMDREYTLIWDGENLEIIWDEEYLANKNKN